jgi:hypothetical protein
MIYTCLDMCTRVHDIYIYMFSSGGRTVTVTVTSQAPVSLSPNLTPHHLLAITSSNIISFNIPSMSILVVNKTGNSFPGTSNSPIATGPTASPKASDDIIKINSACTNILIDELVLKAARRLGQYHYAEAKRRSNGTAKLPATYVHDCVSTAMAHPSSPSGRSKEDSCANLTTSLKAAAQRLARERDLWHASQLAVTMAEATSMTPGQVAEAFKRLPPAIVDGAVHSTRQQGTLRSALLVIYMMAWQTLARNARYMGAPCLWVLHFPDLIQLAKFVQSFQPGGERRAWLASIVAKHMLSMKATGEAPSNVFYGEDIDDGGDGGDDGDDDDEKDDDDDEKDDDKTVANEETDIIVDMFECLADMNVDLFCMPLPDKAGAAGLTADEWDDWPPSAPFIMRVIDRHRLKLLGDGEKPMEIDFASNLYMCCFVQSDARAMGLLLPTCPYAFACIACHVLSNGGGSRHADDTCDERIGDLML